MRLKPSWAGDELLVQATVDRVTIGHSHGTLQAEARSLCITALWVSDEIDARRFQRPFGSLQFWGRRELRGLGIGEMLLRTLVDHAQRRRVTLLHGALAGADLQRQSWLLKFYQRRGFLLLPPTREEGDGTAFRIELWLDAPVSES